MASHSSGAGGDRPHAGTSRRARPLSLPTSDGVGEELPMEELGTDLGDLGQVRAQTRASSAGKDGGDSPHSTTRTRRASGEHSSSLPEVQGYDLGTPAKAQARRVQGTTQGAPSTPAPLTPAPRAAASHTPAPRGASHTAPGHGASSQTPAPRTTSAGHHHSHSHSHTPAPPTPILAQTPLPAPLAEQPEFAELLTPAHLRRRRRPRVALDADAPAGLGVLAGQPLLAGPSRHGWTTDDGDLYRGATSDPTPDPALPHVSNEDAITESSGSSGSSSWSWGSGGVAGLVQRIGGAIGVRRNSTGTFDTSTVSSDSSSSSSSSDGAATRVIGRLGRALTRSVSRATVESNDDRPRRVHVPRRREFTLLLPGPDSGVSAGDSTATLPVAPSPPPPTYPGGVTPSSTPNRVITTPVLQPILEAVRQARAASGIVNPDTIDHHNHKSKAKRGGVAMRRGGSAPGRSRTGQRTFTAPAPRRPLVPRTMSRLEELRGLRGSPALPAGLAVRPKSASDLLGMVGPRSASATSLSGLASLSSLDDGIPTEPSTPSPRGSLDLTPRQKAAWWLDVSCPTWKDLRDIGELLALHPLTLEDVLHQDPREKLDTFDALGYYFVVVRALDEQYFKYTPGSTSSGEPALPGAEIGAAVPGVAHPPAMEAMQDGGHKKERTRRGWGFGRATGRAASKAGEKVEIVEDHPGKEGLEGVAVGGINLYLVVFADGIVSFHYDDVAKHTSRVRDRVLSAPTHEPTSDWIAHGLLDSIVDAFFPLTGYVDGAVDDMDSLTIDPTRDPRDVHRLGETTPPSEDAPFADHIENFVGGKSDEEWIAMDDKDEMVPGLRRRRRDSLAHHINRPLGRARQSAVLRWLEKAASKALARSELNAYNATTPLSKALLYAKLFFLPITTARPKQYMRPVPEVFDRSAVLTSITTLRRLVTGLSRLLGGKHAVVASLLKRATDNKKMLGASNDVEAYLSDVHDHILLLQTSLYHYEYILANCQPAYISYLHVSASTSRGDISSLILALSTVSIGILPMQFLISMFSMNVRVPHNRHDPEVDGPPPYPYYNYFAGVCVGVFLVGCGLVFIIRWWRWRARVKRSGQRGVSVPNTWDGFWGFA